MIHAMLVSLDWTQLSSIGLDLIWRSSHNKEEIQLSFTVSQDSDSRGSDINSLPQQWH